MPAKTMKVHPIAEMFPMMSDEDLDSLAADIKAHGLLEPLVVDAEGMLIDGRNRLEACKRAGVEPEFEEINGHDAAAMIMSANIARRHMTKGAIAMVVAKAYPEPEKGGRGKKSVVATEFPMVSSDKLAHARLVLKLAPELVDLVIGGGRMLDQAYSEAQKRKKDASSEEARMVQLRAGAPDLADLVAEERIKLVEALAAMDERIAEHKRQREVVTKIFQTVLPLLKPHGQTTEEWATEKADLIDPDLWTMPKAGADLSVECVQACSDALAAFAKIWRERNAE